MDRTDTTIKCKVKIEKYTVCKLTSTKTYGNSVSSSKAVVSICRNEFKEVLLSVCCTTGKLSKVPQIFNLKDAELHYKFIKEGKLTVNAKKSSTRVFIMDAPPHILKEFVKTLLVKLEIKTKALSDRDLLAKRPYVKSELQEISPLSKTDIDKANELRSKPKQVLKPTNNQQNPFKRRLPFEDLTNKPQAIKRKILTLTKFNFNSKQKQALESIKRGENVFFTGGAGTGKTFLLKHAIGSLSPSGLFITASTGVAACHIGGITLHQFAGVGKATDSPQECLKQALRKSGTVKRWKSCKNLIIDEISMVSSNFFDILDYLGRAFNVNNKHKPFGGIQLIICGDFFQLPPVYKGTGNNKKFCFQSKAWSNCNFRVVELNQVYRQKDPKFINILRGIRVGLCDKAAAQMLKNTEYNKVSKGSIVATKLCTHRKNVEETNKNCLEKLHGEPRTYTYKDESPYYSTFINQLLPDTVSVTLKVGAQVMLTKNINPSIGLVNGTRGVVTALGKNFPVVKFIGGHEQTIGLERWSVKVTPDLTVIRRQVPLKLGWAVSIHKSQGMTIDFVEMNLEQVFEQGQAYVALSRVRSLEGLRVERFSSSCIRVNPDVIKFYKSIRSLE